MRWTTGPEYDWADGVELRWFAPTEGQMARVRLPGPNGETAAIIELTLVDGTPQYRLMEGQARFTVKVVGSA